MCPKRHWSALGFTLVELLVAQALGLMLITVLTASLSALYARVDVSAGAAENTETAYFLIDVLGSWVRDSRRLIPVAEELPSLNRTGSEDVAAERWDPCLTPVQSPFPFSMVGVAVFSTGDVSCLPSASVESSSPVLLIERRVLCKEDCSEAGFYVALSDSAPGPAVVTWHSGGPQSDRCGDKTRHYQLMRLLVYSRAYSRKVGDGEPALMMSRLAAEPDPRWLRSEMLARAVFDWSARCSQSCDSGEPSVARRSNSLVIEFSVNTRHQSTPVSRTIPLDLWWL